MSRLSQASRRRRIRARVREAAQDNRVAGTGMPPNDHFVRALGEVGCENQAGIKPAAQICLSSKSDASPS